MILFIILESVNPNQWNIQKTLLHKIKHVTGRQKYICKNWPQELCTGWPILQSQRAPSCLGFRYGYCQKNIICSPLTKCIWLTDKGIIYRFHTFLKSAQVVRKVQNRSQKWLLDYLNCFLCSKHVWMAGTALLLQKCVYWLILGNEFKDCNLKAYTVWSN